jgi:glycine hydroxymethyltransferase
MWRRRRFGFFPEVTSTAEITSSDLLRKVEVEQEGSSRTLHLTANENILSTTAMKLVSGPLYSRYHLGNANKRAYTRSGANFLGLLTKSLPAVYALEAAALRAAKRLFGADFCDFRPLSGVHAIISTIASLTDQGDSIYCLSPDEGGHFATTSIVERLGRNCHYLPWNNTRSDFDFDKVEQSFSQYPPRCIYLDHSNSLFSLNLRRLREVAGRDPIIVYDGSHPMGLIAGQMFDNPLDHGCDVLQGSTHKTFPGPQKGMILTRSPELGKRISDTLDTFVSNQHSGDTLALYVTLLEMEKWGDRYAQQTVRNAKVLARSLVEFGFEVFQRDGNATNSHQVLIQGFPDEQHLIAANRLLDCGISVNAKVTLRRKVIRVGIQEVTRRGMTECEMETIANIFSRALLKEEPTTTLIKEVSALVDRHKGVKFSFDDQL